MVELIENTIVRIKGQNRPIVIESTRYETFIMEKILKLMFQSIGQGSLNQQKSCTL